MNVSPPRALLPSYPPNPHTLQVRPPPSRPTPTTLKTYDRVAHASLVPLSLVVLDLITDPAQTSHAAPTKSKARGRKAPHCTALQPRTSLVLETTPLVINILKSPSPSVPVSHSPPLTISHETPRPHILPILFYPILSSPLRSTARKLASC